MWCFFFIPYHGHLAQPAYLGDQRWESEGGVHWSLGAFENVLSDNPVDIEGDIAADCIHV